MNPANPARLLKPAVALIIFVGLLAYGPWLLRLGFYRDDWYQLWAGVSLGPRSIVTLFSIDRPAMGYLYAATFALFRDTPLLWQIYSLFLRLLGGLAFLWFLLRLWPHRYRFATSAVLIFLVYPGFLQQPNANTFSNHLFSYTAGLISLAASLEALHATNRRRAFAFQGLAVIGGLGCWLTYEYMIGLEAVRYLLIAVHSGWPVAISNRRKGMLFFARSLPTAVPLLAFLVWRVFLFESSRNAVDIRLVFETYRSSPVQMLGGRLLELAKDVLEVVFFGWGVPVHEAWLALQGGDWILAIALGATASAAYLAFSQRMAGGDRPGSPGAPAGFRTFQRQVILLGSFTIVATLLPVIVAGRDIRWTSAFDRYTLHVTAGVGLLVVGLVFWLVRPAFAPAVISLLLGLSVFAHSGNAVSWARFWEEERQLWWQLSWRAPQIKSGTVLVGRLASFRFFEDYEIWGPANLTYRPGEAIPQIAAQVLAEETAGQVRRGELDVRHMRVLIAIPRDFQRSLILAWPTPESCLHVLERDQIELSEHTSALVRSLAPYSHGEQIDPNGAPAVPPRRIFGAEPKHGWCWFYQAASLGRQRGAWETVANLGDEVIDLGFRPADPTEWMPFFHAYVNLGLLDTAGRIAGFIRSDDPTRRSLCEDLTGHYFRNDVTQEIGRRILCD